MAVLFLVAAVFFLVVPSLDLHTKEEDFVGSLLRGFALFAGFRALSRIVEAWGNAAANSTWAEGNPSARSLVPFATRMGKVVVFAVGVVALISALGYPAGTLLAGLGVGGLAVALAGQKTVENLFGAMSISVDQPFRVGDFVKVEDFTGTVESIGLRSTRIRTLDRTVISLPNGRGNADTVLEREHAEWFGSAGGAECGTSASSGSSTSLDRVPSKWCPGLGVGSKRAARR